MGVIEEIPERAIVKVAKPVGVIGALSPSTNPEATPVIKAISAVKGRNSIIVTPHPRAGKTNKMICDKMREAIVKMGAPADLVIGVDNPSVIKTKELMAQCDRILATGGSAMVTAAYSSGTPALGVGVGNAVITVGGGVGGFSVWLWGKEGAERLIRAQALKAAAALAPPARRRATLAT